MKKRSIWKIAELTEIAVSAAEEYGISSFLAQTLINRGIKKENFLSFMKASFDSLYPPFLLPDMEKAVKRLEKAVGGGEKVMVCGDYDVDGVTSLAIFYEFARKFKNFSFYIPHRIKEGYGLNEESIRKAKKEGFTLLIAFDCGTNACKEVKLANRLGLDVIIIDHHCPQESLPPSLAFINPKRSDSRYPFDELSSAALSFKFLQAITSRPCRQVLDLVALSLVCDVVPLVGENRILLKEGLKVIKKSNRPAIKALCEVGRIRQENIDTFHIGFVLGPRINASGRVSHAKESLELFFTEDEGQALKKAARLSEHNRLRKGIEGRILKEAEEIIQRDQDKDHAIIVSGKQWHPGVLGIVASRLAYKYYKPSFVFSFSEDGTGKGSARSIHSVHLMDVLEECSDSLILYGGHKKAAGIHISENKLTGFREKINAFLKTRLEAEDLLPVLEIDSRISFSDIDIGLVEELDSLKPHGEGNPQALFAAYGIRKKNMPKKTNYGYSVWLTDSSTTLEGIVYDKDILEILRYADNLDIVFFLSKNNYHNLPRLTIKDCRIS